MRLMSVTAICTPARSLSAIALLMFAALGVGCATLIPRDVVPARLADEAALAGMPNVRIWGDASTESVAALVSAERPRKGALAERAEVQGSNRRNSTSSPSRVEATTARSAPVSWSAGAMPGPDPISILSPASAQVRSRRHSSISDEAGMQS